MTTSCDHVWDVAGPYSLVCTDCGHVAEHDLPPITDDQVTQAMAAWGERVGMDDALEGRPEDPDHHCPNITFADHYVIAYTDTVRAMAEVARMELPRVGAGDQAGGAQGTRPAGNTIPWRHRILWASADRAEQQLELERRTNAGLRGLAQMLIERLDHSTPVRHDGPGDVW